MVWEDLVLSYVDYGYPTTVNGTQTCQTTTLDYNALNANLSSYDGKLSSSIPASLLSLGIQYFLDSARFPNSQFFSSYGVTLPADCSVTQTPGSPIAQVPVQYLTATSTINNVPTLDGASSPSSTTPASPGSTLQQPGPTPTEDPTGSPDSSPSESSGSDDGQGASSSQDSGSGQSGVLGSSPGQAQSTALPQEQSSTPPDASVNPSPSAAGPSPVATVITMAGVPFSISGNTVYVGSQTLTPGGAITVSGTLVSVAASATAVVIGTSTIPLSPSAANPVGSPPVLSLAGYTFVENPASVFIIGSQTLTPGGVITFDGSTVSLVLSATAVVIGTNTIPLSPGLGTPASSPEVLTLGGSVFTANSVSGFVIGSQTLTAGGVLTVSGTVVSLAPEGSAVVIGSSTEVLAGVSATASVDVGGIIYSAFGGGSGTASVESAATTGSVSPGFATGASSPLDQTPVRWIMYGWLMTWFSVWILCR